MFNKLVEKTFHRKYENILRLKYYLEVYTVNNV